MYPMIHYMLKVKNKGFVTDIKSITYFNLLDRIKRTVEVDDVVISRERPKIFMKTGSRPYEQIRQQVEAVEKFLEEEVEYIKVEL